MIKKVKLKDSVMPSRIGCADADHFNDNIRGKHLRVIEEESHALKIQDETGEQFIVLKSDLEDKEVSHA